MYQAPRGTRDFTPEEMQKRQYVEENIRSTFQSFGYQEIQTPTFENLKLFTAKSGETIIDEIYSFTDKGGRDLALRPELTAPVIRFYVDKLQMRPKPLKLFYFGNCYRYDRPQKGRYREFRQAGCEIIGVDTPEAYAELIALSYTILEKLGLKNIQLNIGNLRILDCLFKKYKLTKKQQKYITPLIDKSQYTDLQDALKDFNLSDKNSKEFIEALQLSNINKLQGYIEINGNIEKEINKQKQIMNLLGDSFDIKNYHFKLGIVRGLDYYTDIVFEIEAPELGAEKQLCGGGGYELIRLFGGKETPTAGFAIGFDRTILALETEGYIFPTSRLDAYVIPVNKEMISKSLQIAQQLRKQGCIIDVDLMRRGIGKSLKYANSRNSKKAIIVGPDELKQNSVTIRDMETGEQKLVEIKNILEYIK